MSRPRFLADHDLNGRIIKGLRRREQMLDIVRLREVLPIESSDTEVLAYAAGAGLIVVSHDVKTMIAAAHQRLASGELMNGLVVIRQPIPLALVIEDLLLIWFASEAEEWYGQTVFLPL